MNILIIDGYPGKNGLSKYLMEKYYEEIKNSKHFVKKIHVYNLKFDFILHEGYKNQNPLESDLKKAQELISWADHLIFFYPIWWTDIPSLLKSFFERIFLPGFAFKYVNGKKLKLLKGKSAEIIATGGASNIFCKTLGKMAQYRVFGVNLRFCGISTKWSKIKIYGKIKPSTKKEYIERIVLNIKKRARKV
ncbi:MAG: NAD(P)H-dependent oxidoreductase [Nanoarchaeota archaeon]|nr:NAD(P)H-dependent oxidoreductase [Nanoarchaeota archaeon]